MPATLGSSGPTIRISRGSGSGPTRMAAFDTALRAAGMQDFNLIRLSSIIPGGSRLVVVDGVDQIAGEFGDGVFSVYAEAHASTAGDQAWAGLGWALRSDGCGAGLFMEQAGSSESTVQTSIDVSLSAMADGRTEPYALAGRLLSGITCSDDPVSAVVIASYRSMRWSDPGPTWSVDRL